MMTRRLQYLQWAKEIPQLVPYEWCEQCQICCKFPHSGQAQTPSWSEEEVADFKPAWLAPQGSGYSPSLKPYNETSCVCPGLSEEAYRCDVYNDRPLDCRLYPFVLTQNRDQGQPLLALDTKCPYVQEHSASTLLEQYTEQLKRHFESPEADTYLQAHPDVCDAWWPEFVPMKALQQPLRAQQAAKPPHPLLSAWQEKDLLRLQEMLRYLEPSITTLSLGQLLGWQDLLPLWVLDLGHALAFYVVLPTGAYMPTPPLGCYSPEDLKLAIQVLRELPGEPSMKRIEGIDEETCQSFQSLSMPVEASEWEYLYRRHSIAQFSGALYKSQRWAANQCMKTAGITFRAYNPEQDAADCLRLYTRWALVKHARIQHDFEHAMIRDSLFFHRRLLTSSATWGCSGTVAMQDGKIVGYTLGEALSPRMFAVHLEVTDLAIRGLSQALFRAFSSTIEQPLLNVGSDCGISALRWTKSSYRPIGWGKQFRAQLV